MNDSPNPPARPRADDDPPRDGVRIEYRATVPRHLLGAAIAEAFDIIHQETQPPAERPTCD
ncbi:hypothetical protein [Streptomyces prunicolor]|uniref:hypothetical protein n=1 Tax=Streptomyces prunicolor TaxID=67348 RepID=UPI000381631F|nr:hypothetical protein [Streptomyces prunicolor]